MGSAEEASAAIAAVNGTNVGGRDLAVNEARPKEDRPRTFGGGDRGGDRGGYGGGGGGGRGGERSYGGGAAAVAATVTADAVTSSVPLYADYL